MGKFYGKIGYGIPKETRPGIYKSEIKEYMYTGDLMQNYYVTQQTSSDKVNDDVTIDYKFSIIADPFAYENITRMKYVEYMGVLWKIRKAEPQRPRIILTVGGVYNGPKQD